MRSCLVTGATGLIGRSLLPILSRSWHVHALVHNARSPAPHSPQVSYLSADLAADLETHRFPRSIDAVVHLAQSNRFRDCPAQAEHVFKVNTISSLHLLQYALQSGAKQFVLASTGGVYAPSNQPCTEEQLLQRPRGQTLGYYADSKLSAEAICRCYAEQLGVTILRPFFVYGPGQDGRMFIPRLAERIRRQESIEIGPGDTPLFNPIYVDDAVLAIQVAMERPAEGVFNLAGPEVLSLKAIAETIGNRLNRKVDFTRTPTQDRKSLIGSIKKMSAQLRAPTVDFDSGIKNYFSGCDGIN